MPNIAFVANFHMTETFYAMATSLERRGVGVYWFTFSSYWSNWLKGRDVGSDRIIRLSEAMRGLALGPGLPDSCREPWEPTALEAIEGDRVLRARPISQTVGQLAACCERFKDGVNKFGLSAVFGEATWAAEVVLSYAAKEIGVPYLAPHMIRYPTSRFGFFRAPSQASLVRLRDPEPGDRAVAEATVARLLDDGAQADGLWASSRVSMDRFVRRPGLLAEKFWLGLMDSRSNPTQMTVREYLRNKNPYILKRRTAKAAAVMTNALSTPEQADGPFLLMPLQVQPEASVDVLAWWARDQVRNAREIARASRGRFSVGVKEHAHQFGSRPLEFYEALRALPGVFLIDAFAASRAWADAATAVITPTGTMALENALRGRPSIVFTRVFFDQLATVSVLERNGYSTICDRIPLPRQASAFEESSAFLETLMSHSHPGVISNPRSDPRVLDRHNVESLVEGCLLLLTSLAGSE